jgi:transaldolase
VGIYLDSAIPEHARRAQQLGFIEGVTTNPLHIAQTGRPGLDVLAELVEIVEGHVFYQVTAPTVEGRYDQAWEAHDIRPDKVVIKIPSTTANLAMATRLAASGIECLMTAVATPAQAYLAALAEASFVAPYVSRMTRRGGDGVAIVRDMARILAGTETQILSASLKSVEEVVQVLLAGAHHVTMPLDLILAMGEDDFTQEAIREFDAASLRETG